MNAVKSQLRVFLKAKRLGMDVEARIKASAKICERLKTGINWDEMDNIHVFDPIESLGEVDLRELYEWLTKNHANIHIYTSKKIGNDWHVTKFHEESPTEPPSLDLVIVPMLGFDQARNRIGYGGGYYDKLLKRYSSAQKIGVCYESGKVKAIPVEPHDVKLHDIVTEI